MAERSTSSSNSNEQVNNSIKSIIELTTRIDERVQAIMKKQDLLESKSNNQSDTLHTLNTDLLLLESISGKVLQEEVKKISNDIINIKSRLENVENKTNVQENKWKTVVDFILKIIWILITAYLLIKLGLQVPAIL
jgi:hypothetical protein